MPQQAWSDKRERQYEHVKESIEEGKKEGKYKGRDPEEIAARTVNKTREEKGETKED
jgi:DNA invertase Pin-like site-specific DNA recombinase